MDHLLALKGVRNRQTVQVVTGISSSATSIYLEQLVLDRLNP